MKQSFNGKLALKREKQKEDQSKIKNNKLTNHNDVDEKVRKTNVENIRYLKA